MEHWKDIPGFEGFYKISDRGRIRSATHEIVHQSKGPYRGVSLRRYGLSWIVQVHALVLLAFRGECPEKYVRHHKNGKTTDNRLVNLEYVPRRKHAAHGPGSLHRKAGACGRRGAKNHLAKLTASKVRRIRKAAAKGEMHGAIAKRFKVSRTNICMIVNRQRWDHVA